MNGQEARERAGLAYLIGIVGALLIVGALSWAIYRYTQPPPLGPLLPEGVKELADDEIVLADWDESPFKPQKGEPITLSYYEPKERADYDVTKSDRRPRFAGDWVTICAGPLQRATNSHHAMQ